MSSFNTSKTLGTVKLASDWLILLPHFHYSTSYFLFSVSYFPFLLLPESHFSQRFLYSKYFHTWHLDIKPYHDRTCKSVTFVFKKVKSHFVMPLIQKAFGSLPFFFSFFLQTMSRGSTMCMIFFPAVPTGLFILTFVNIPQVPT